MVYKILLMRMILFLSSNATAMLGNDHFLKDMEKLTLSPRISEARIDDTPKVSTSSILIVDDNEMNRKLIKRLLEKWG